MKKILYLTLKKEWFDKIRTGEKTVEFRNYSKHWKQRFFEKWTKQFKSFDLVEFRNGYKKNSPKITTEFLWFEITGSDTKTDLWRGKFFIIILGKILH